MTKDILEQVAEDFFREKGYFSQHNVPYRSKNKGVHSDIDVLAVHPLTKDVVVVSCKSEGSGLNIKSTLSSLKNNPNKKIKGKIICKKYPEIAIAVRAKALREKVRLLTGRGSFTFYLCVTKYTESEDKNKWENFPLFKKNLRGCPIKLIDFKEIIDFLTKRVREELKGTPSHSDSTRFIQLADLAGLEIIKKEK